PGNPGHPGGKQGALWHGPPLQVPHASEGPCATAPPQRREAARPLAEARPQGLGPGPRHGRRGSRAPARGDHPAQQSRQAPRLCPRRRLRQMAARLSGPRRQPRQLPRRRQRPSGRPASLDSDLHIHWPKLEEHTSCLSNNSRRPVRSFGSALDPL
ncbi:unnamed protein product, partial [Prorocentrum cordatum]